MGRTAIRGSQIRDASVQIADLEDFAVLIGSGLHVAVQSGRLRNGLTILDTSVTSLLLTNNSTNYVELSSTGVTTANIIGFTTGRVPLAIVVTSSGTVSSIVDKRSWSLFLTTGPQGITGPRGITGPNSVTTATQTGLTGFIKGDGSFCSADNSAYYKSGDSPSFNNLTLIGHIIGGDATSSPYNYIRNGSFETWTGLTDFSIDGGFETWSSASVCTAWPFQDGGSGGSLAREAAIIKQGTYSARLISGSAIVFCNQTLSNPTNYRSQTWVIGAWVYSTGAGAYIRITDSTSSTLSNTHTGTGWEYLTGVRTFGAGITSVDLYIINPTPGNTSYFDSLKFYKMLAPDSWVNFGSGSIVSREEGTVKVGTYSAKMVRNGTDCFIYNSDYANFAGRGTSYWKGRTVTLGCCVWASVANRARISFYDGVNLVYSAYHTGNSTWQLLPLTVTISNLASGIYAECGIDTGDTTAFFDVLTLNEGYTPFIFNEPPALSTPIPVGGTGSAGSGKQYVVINVNGVNYKVLHDGVV